MNRRRIYIYSLWLATCVVLLSTVVLHHHHMESVCFVEERCADDGAVNDRHTGHEDNERGECSLGKIHRFVINSKTVSAVRRHIFYGSHTPLTALPVAYVPVMQWCVGVAQWPSEPSPGACSTLLPSVSRRGPPAYSFVG